MVIKSNSLNTYHNWKLCNYEDINIWLLSNSLNYWTAVIDSFRFYKKETGIFLIWLDLYIDRFLKSVEYRWFELEETKEQIIKILKVLLFKNKDLVNPYARMVAYIWDDNLDILNCNINFWITIFDLNVNSRDLSCDFSSFLRSETKSNSLKLSSNYSKNIIEQVKYKRKWIDISVFLWEREEILEWLSENIFCIKWNKIYTPSLWNIVNWINRQIVLLLLKKNWFEIVEKEINKKEFEVSDEIFITWTATGIRNIYKVWNKLIWDWKNYNISNKIKAIFNNDIFWYNSLWNIKITKLL